MHETPADRPRRASDRPTRAAIERVQRGREFRIANISQFLKAQAELADASDDHLRTMAIGLMGEYCRPWPPEGGAIKLPGESL